MYKILFTFILISLFPSFLSAQSDLKFQVQVNLNQNILQNDRPGIGIRADSETFDEIFILPQLKGTLVYPLGKQFELLANISFNVFGGKLNRSDGNTVREEFYAVGLGLGASYLITPKLHISAFADLNHIFKVNERLENSVISSLNRDVTDRYIKNVIRPGFQVSYFISRVYVAGQFSFVPANLYDQKGDYINSEKKHTSFGIAVGYRFK